MHLLQQQLLSQNHQNTQLCRAMETNSNPKQQEQQEKHQRKHTISSDL